MKSWKTRGTAFLLLLVSSFMFVNGFISSSIVTTAVANELGPGVPAPEFSLRMLAGTQVVHASELFAHQPFTLLVFWNSDCPDCLDALEECQKLIDVARARGVELVGINHDSENIASVRSFLKSKNITFPQLSDIDRLVATSYGTDSYSLSLFLIDATGVVLEAEYGYPPDTEEVLSRMIEKCGGETEKLAEKKRGGRPQLKELRAKIARDKSVLLPSSPPLPPSRQSTVDQGLPSKKASGITITGDVRIRVMDIQMSHDPSIPNPPTGPYGEDIEQGRSVTHRFECELSSRVTNSLTAGALLRLSNEDEGILRFGPQYFSRSEGSAYAQYRAGDFSLRLGYFDVYFSPLSLMRWDSEDNPRAGGTAAGCAVCAGATGAILMESLEELGPELTFEGMNVSGALGDLLDLKAFYGRPRTANEITMGEFLANSEVLSDFAYRRDLYGLRANFNVLPPTLPGRVLIALHYVRTKDDTASATFVGSDYDPTGFAIDNRVYGAVLSVPLHRRFSLEVEIEQTETDEDVRGTSDTVDSGTGFLASLTGEILRDVKASVAYLSMSKEFHSSFAALSYLPNRKGARASLNVQRAQFNCDVFAKYLEPYGTEGTGEPSPFLPNTRARVKNELTLGLWASTGVLKLFDIGGGWLFERKTNDVYHYSGPIPSADYQHLELQHRKNILTFQVARSFSARNSVEFLYQYMDYVDEIESMNDYTTHRTSLQFSLRF